MIRRERVWKREGRKQESYHPHSFLLLFFLLFFLQIVIFLFVQKRSSVLVLVPLFVSESLESPTRSGKCLGTDGLTTFLRGKLTYATS